MSDDRMADPLKPPNRIYLQWLGEDSLSFAGDKVDTNEVTWCADKLWDTDLEYVLSPRTLKKLKRLRGR
jgi:hypothetical protein